MARLRALPVLECGSLSGEICMDTESGLVAGSDSGGCGDYTG